MDISSHQIDPVRRRRLRWRARRGLLENDLMLTRFLDEYEVSLSDEEVSGLNQLLDLTDNDLLELLLGRTEPAADICTQELSSVLARIRSS